MVTSIVYTYNHGNILFVKGVCTFDGIAEPEVAESEEPNAIFFFFYEIAYFSIYF